ncbi:MAG: chloride channel protein [Planctomycetes bacterium]|nr:chloride channel protein [Planctomycetota bacterium]
MTTAEPTTPAISDDGASGNAAPPRSALGDYTVTSRVIFISALTVCVGLICALVSLGLQRLIALFTNLFYFQTFSFAESASPANHHLGYWSVLVPAAGGLIVGLLARFGTDRIRGHGIPEAIEAILIGRSRMSPKVAVLKPLSSAIAIGSGGPFGAEGPIIMTGGAFGSLIGQCFHLTSNERKTLLVAGAAGGMSATFGTPLAAVLVAIELLLFEWKPRSLIPVVLASAVATAARPLLHLGAMPLVSVPLHGAVPSTMILLASLVAGLGTGVLSNLVTLAVYTAEDLFHRLPIHWMWWPTLGGLVVGLGGLIEPHALGIGYDVIFDALKGNYVIGAALALMIVKAIIWATALGSGTSGGVLAPLLMQGALFGGLLSGVLPADDPRLWPLVCLAAMMGSTMRAPLTGVIFALEMTYDLRLLLPILIATFVAYGFTVLTMRRSILTERIARRGRHVSYEFTIDPLERVRVAEVMTTNVVTVPGGLGLHELVHDYFLGHGALKHDGYPVVDDAGKLLGVVTQSDLLEEWYQAAANPQAESSPIVAYDLVADPPLTITGSDTCRAAAELMAEHHVSRLLVVADDAPERLVGVITSGDLLKPRVRQLEEEQLRERVFSTHLPRFPRRDAPAQ